MIHYRVPTDEEITLRAAALADRVARAQVPRSNDEIFAATVREQQAIHVASELDATDGLLDIPTVTGDVTDLAVGEVARAGPTVGGYAQAAVAVDPGAAVAVGVTVVSSDVGYVGLQWIDADGVGGDIVWGSSGAAGDRVVVGGTAPDATAGARYIVVNWDDPSLHVDEPELYTELVSLRAWRTARGDFG